MTSVGNILNARGSYTSSGIRLLQFCFFTTTSFYSIARSSSPVCITALGVFVLSEWSRPQRSAVCGETQTALLIGFLPFTESCCGVTVCPLHRCAPSRSSQSDGTQKAGPQNIQHTFACYLPILATRNENETQR